jgi:GxxExxY protein
MNTNKHELIHKELSYRIMKSAMGVHNILGAGFLEKVYENALAIKLKKDGLKVIQQAPFKVYFEGEVVGEYYADILVEGKVIIEAKCVDKIIDIHRAQVINYLKATKLNLAIIINFAKTKLEYERIVL